MPANLTGPVIQQSGVAKKLEGPAASLDIQEGRTEPQATGHKLQATSFYFFFFLGGPRPHALLENKKIFFLTISYNILYLNHE